MSVIPIIENTFFANGRCWGGLNSSLYKSGSFWVMKTGIASADLNMVWSEKPLTEGDLRAIGDIEKDFQKARLPFWCWVFPSAQSQATRDILNAGGFTVVDSIPSMLADLSRPSADLNDNGLQFVQVQNRETLCLWEAVSFAGFDFPQQTKHQYRQFIDTFDLSPGSPQKYYLASFNGKPVATSLLFLHENAGGIYFVSTLAQYRKKGIGLAVTQATMGAAKHAGAQYATLQSSPDGIHIYQQAGFQEYCRVDVYGLNSV
ncbi:MAG: GNAT family N-acetyltransferase [Smithellaceae bacterium]